MRHWLCSSLKRPGITGVSVEASTVFGLLGPFPEAAYQPSEDRYIPQMG